MNIKATFFAAVVVVFSLSVEAQTTLNERCVINVLNRTIQVGKDGGWALPNIPSFMGRLRARATCILGDGTTVSGQSEYFTLTTNSVTRIGDIKFEDLEAIPTELNFAPGTPISLTGVGKTQQLAVVAKYRDGQENDVTATNGINYSTTNVEIATVSAGGIVTARGNGNVIINARKDGVLASQRITITTSGDLDDDGLPDKWELDNGLNPNDPVDAQEDKDGDGLTTLVEYETGTNPSLTDTDSDGLSDSKELNETNTSPLLADTDGDGLNDNIELLTNTNPRSAASANYRAAVQSISVSPPTVVLTFSGVDTEVSTQLKVSGKLLDGSLIDLTSKMRGTTYASSNLTVVNFGAEDGKIFGGSEGSAVVTITNGDHSIPLAISVESFVPSPVSAVAIPGYANNVDVTGDLAFVAAGDAGLQVIDISNRKSPKIIGALDTDGVAIDLKVRGNYVYLADGESGLKIIDTAVPNTPKLVGSLDTSGVSQDIQIYGNYAYLANGVNGIEIVDISSASQPQSVSILDNLGDVKGIDVEGFLLVIAAGSSLSTIDIAEKTNPVLIGNINLGLVKDVIISDGIVYAAVFTSGYRVVSVKDPGSPVVLGGEATFAPRDVALTNNGLALFAQQTTGPGVAYVNVSEAENPKWGGTIYTVPLLAVGPPIPGGATGLAVDSSYAYYTADTFLSSRDYGSLGESKLYIAQYRMNNDTVSVAPSVSITSPEHGQVVVENKNILLTATADDDVAVKQVDFIVDGMSASSDTTFPYVAPFVTPSIKRFINVQARAIDLGGNSTLSDIIRVNIQPDKDNDDLGNDEEGDTYNTDPTKFDTDGDGLGDGREVLLHTNPTMADTDNDGISDGEEVVQGTDPLNPDVTKPQIESTTPIASAIGVGENQGIIFRFNESISPKSVKRSSIVLRQVGYVPTEGNASFLSSREILFTPNNLLQSNSEHIIRMEGVRDLAGNPLELTYEFNFTTGKTTDLVKPVVTAITPANASVDVPVNSALTIEMSEQINASSLDVTKLYVTDAVLNQNIAGSFSVNEDKTLITFVPVRAFLVGRKHNIFVGGIKDLFGNLMTSVNYNFTTAFNADGKSPEIVATTVVNGDINVPLNVRLQVSFNEAISGLSGRLLLLKLNNDYVQISHSIGSEGRVLTIKPLVPLQPSSTYEFIIGAVKDLSGNPLAKEQRINFTTGLGSDTLSGNIVSYSPGYNAVGVPLNANLEMRFNEVIDITSAAGALRLKDESASLYVGSYDRYVEGVTNTSSDRKSLLFVPSHPLASGRKYTLSTKSGISDLAGNFFNYYSFPFSTSAAQDNQAPVATFNFPSGSENLPLNLNMRILLSESINRSCLDNQTARLTIAGSSESIPGILTYNDYENSLIFITGSDLSSSTSYELSLTGICDFSGNKLADIKHSFTTGTAGLIDTIPPYLVSVSPEIGAQGVDTKAKITLTFNELIDQTQLDASVVANGIVGKIAGDWTTSGNTLTFMPLNEYPSGARIDVTVNAIHDAAGNRNDYFRSNFTVVEMVDKTPPQLINVTPENGAMDIGPLTPIVLTFSESLKESTINGDNFFFYIDGAIQRTGVSRSADNRTITMGVPVPTGKPVTIVVTSAVTDNAGNEFSDFTSTFNTAVVDTDFARPSVVRQLPISGASNVRQLERIVLYASKELNAGTIDNSVQIAANGNLISGKVTLDSNNQAITFVPNQSFPENALIEVFLTNQLRDLSGNLFNTYRGTFRTGSNSGSTLNIKPDVEALYPIQGQVDVTLNPRIEVAFNQTMKASALNANTVQLRKGSALGVVQSTDILLSNDGLRIRIQPIALLEPNTRYYLNLSSDIEDIDGEKAASNKSFYFNTGIGSIADTQSPILTRSSPSDGEKIVPVNPTFHLQFDEPIHPFSVIAKGNEQVTFLAGNREIRYVKDHVLLSNSVIKETLSGISDVSGNVITDQTIAFNTTSTVDVLPPTVLSTNPSSGAIDVPVNSLIVLVMSEPINPLSISTSSFYIYDTILKKNVTALPSINGSGFELSLTPLAPLAAGRSYNVIISNLQDRVGNAVSYSTSFTTSFQSDLIVPTIEAIGIDEAQVVPLNARMRVRFSEPLNSHKLDGVVLTLNGQPVVVVKELSGDRLLLTLTPQQLLQQGASYSLLISGLEDLSGNKLVASVERHFVAGIKVDAIKSLTTATVPANGANNVSLNTPIEIRFNKPIDPTVKLSGDWLLTDDSENVAVGGGGYMIGRKIEGLMTVSKDRMSLIFVPKTQLKVGHKYTIHIGSGGDLYDQAGNSVGYLNASFITSDVVDNVAPNVADASFASLSTDLPVNTQLRLTFNESLNSLSVNDQTVRLVQSGSAEVILGSVVLTNNGRSLTFTPNNNLLTLTGYELVLEGVRDLAGTTLPILRHSFITGSNEQPDTAAPYLETSLPESDSVDVDATSKIDLTFNELISGAHLGNLQVTASGISGQIAGTWVASGKTLTFSPLTSLPSYAQIYVYMYGIQDLAGNVMPSSSILFSTGFEADNVPPQVISVSPNNGSMDIGPLSTIILNFSESLRESTINSNNIFIYTNGHVERPNVYRSADNRTVSLSTSLPPASSVTVVITDDVTDNFGNKITNFASTFSTAVIDTSLTRPSVVSQVPMAGASNVRELNHITLYVDSPLNEGTLIEGFYVTANGKPINGSRSVESSGQAITFAPDQQFPENALVEIFLTDRLMGLNGRHFNNFRSSFQTGSNSGSIPLIIPTVEAQYPMSGQVGVTSNPLIEVSFNQTLKATSVNANTIQLRKGSISGVIQPTNILLSDDAFRVRVKPISLLDPNTRYYLQINPNIEDLDGDKSTITNSYYFTTSSDGLADNQPPIVTLTSPSDGAQDIPVNPTFYVRFDESIHPLSMLAKGKDQIAFLAGNKEVRYIKNHVLVGGIENKETISGVLDLSGNLIAENIISFETSNRVDTIKPSIVSSSPRADATAVPLNTVVSILLSESVNAFTINSESFYIYDYVLSRKVDATLSISSDAKQLTLTPTSPLAASQRYTVFSPGLKDIANNGESFYFYFTTGTQTDLVAPQLEMVSVDDGQSDLPLNSRLRVRFSEPINIQKLDGITLLSAGSIVAVNRELSSDRRVLDIVPKQLLAPSANYLLSINGVEDLSGNELITPVLRNFSTATKVDTTQGSIVSYTPASRAVNVALNSSIKMRFNERIDPTSVLDYIFSGYQNAVVVLYNANFVPQDGTAIVDLDRKGLVFIPKAPLTPSTKYTVYVSSNPYLRDLAGNTFPSSNSSFTTASQ